eukprot:COSAG02_NODE_31363_length_535_cov_0.623853_2_plen_61_part_01
MQSLGQWTPLWAAALQAHHGFHDLTWPPLCLLSTGPNNAALCQAVQLRWSCMEANLWILLD